MRILFAMLAMVAALTFVPLVRAADPEPRTISTNGEATVFVVPDKVIVNLGIETYDINLDEAKSANAKAATTLVQAIQGLGVDKKDMATDNVQVEIRRISKDGVIETTSGYFVRRGYAVTLKDTKLFEKLIDTALKNGANQIHDVSFETTELRKYRDQARQMAIKAAKEKAVLLAGALDMQVGRPHNISEGGGDSYFGGYRFGNMSQNAMQSVSGAPDTGENLPLGQIAVTASVSVTFDLQ